MPRAASKSVKRPPAPEPALGSTGGSFIIEIPERDEKGRDLRNLTARWRVESLPGHHTVVKKFEAKGSLVVAADPGMYTWNATHYTTTAPHLNFKFSGTVLHGMTKSQWESLQYIRPKIARCMHTRRGVVWRCQFIGCGANHTNRIAAATHEAEHQGIDLMAQPERIPEAEESIKMVAKEIQEVKKQRGRPRKSATGLGERID